MEISEGIIEYEKSLAINSKNTFALNNRGYTYNLMGKYEKAILDFNMALELEEGFAYSLNNRGFAKIKLGMKKEGLIDFKKSMTLDGENSYCYMNLGIYYFDNKDYTKALENFNIAFKLDKNTHLLKEHIEKTKEKLNIK